MLTLLFLLAIAYVWDIIVIARNCKANDEPFHPVLGATLFQWLLFCVGTIVFGGLIIYFIANYLP